MSTLSKQQVSSFESVRTKFETTIGDGSLADISPTKVSFILSIRNIPLRVTLRIAMENDFKSFFHLLIFLTIIFLSLTSKQLSLRVFLNSRVTTITQHSPGCAI